MRGRYILTRIQNEDDWCFVHTEYVEGNGYAIDNEDFAELTKWCAEQFGEPKHRGDPDWRWSFTISGTFVYIKYDTDAVNFRLRFG